MSTKPYDQAFKFLAEEDPQTLLIVLGAIKAGQAAHIEILAREVSVAARLPDQPYKVTIDGKDVVVHVEAQTVYESDIAQRMLNYAVRLWLKYDLPVSSYLFILSDRNTPKILPEGAVTEAGDLQMKLDFHIVRLSEISASDLLSMNRESLLPFIPLTKDSENALEEGARRLRSVSRQTRREELSLYFFLLGSLRYNPEKLADVLGRESMLSIELLRQTPAYQNILEEGREQGLEQGREEGREQGLEQGLERGLEQGRQEGLRQGLEQGLNQGEAAMLRRQLEHRFGALSDQIIEKIERATRSELERWGTDLFGASSIEEIFAER